MRLAGGSFLAGSMIEAFSAGVRMASHLFMRGVYPYWQWPFKLARLGAGDADQDAVHVARELFSTQRCCRDLGFTDRLHA
eukprot:7693946-Alexandrium_andersonii.AAC.1